MMSEDTTLYKRLFQLYVIMLFMMFGLMGALNLIAHEDEAYLTVQDGATFLAAGHLAYDESFSEIYPRWTSAGTQFKSGYAAEYCQITNKSPNACAEFMVPFVSPPALLAPYMLLGLFPNTIAVALIRLSSVVAIVWGAQTLYRPVSLRLPLARPLVFTLFALLPFANNPIENGQNSPLLFALACCGPLLTRPLKRMPSLLISATLAFICIAKLSPLIFIGLLLVAKQRQTALVTALLITLSVITSLLLFPASLYTAFLDSSRQMVAWITAFPGNTSLDTALRLSLRSAGLEQGFFIIQLFKSALIVGLSGWLIYRKTPIESLWPLSWMLWLLLIPLNWWHYYWVVVAGLLSLVLPKLKQEAYAWALSAWIILPLIGGLPLVVKAKPIAVYIGSGFSLISTALCLYFVLSPSLNIKLKHK